MRNMARYLPRRLLGQRAGFFSRGFQSAAYALAPKVVATRVLPPRSQARLLAQDFNLTQWQQDSAMPRDVLLQEARGREEEP